MEPREVLPGSSAEVGTGPAPETQPAGERQTTTPEQTRGLESRETAPQAPSAPQQPPPAAVQPTLPAPQAHATQDDDAKTSAAAPTSADDGLIEKEWVDKAKKIVAQTRDDPYEQEKEVSKLQADYLKKRYGKEIKVSN